ncbi:MAG: pyrrolo-quinoline quinone, partial [Planctomycetota bacterium]
VIDNSNVQMAAPAICDGRLYFLERRSGNVHCIDAATGHLEYRQRISGARAFWASPVSCGDRVYCFDAGGTTHVLAAGPEYKRLNRNPTDEQTWSSPAIANDSLYLRTVDHLICIR